MWFIFSASERVWLFDNTRPSSPLPSHLRVLPRIRRGRPLVARGLVRMAAHRQTATAHCGRRCAASRRDAQARGAHAAGWCSRHAAHPGRGRGALWRYGHSRGWRQPCGWWQPDGWLRGAGALTHCIEAPAESIAILVRIPRAIPRAPHGCLHDVVIVLAESRSFRRWRTHQRRRRCCSRAWVSKSASSEAREEGLQLKERVLSGGGGWGRKGRGGPVRPRWVVEGDGRPLCRGRC
jgi:hypothetical protein